MRRLSDLVQSFLHYGKPIEIFPAPTDVRQLVDGVVALSESKMKSQGIDLVEECNGVPPILNVDAEKLRALLYQRGRQRYPGDAGGRHDADRVPAPRRRLDGDQFLGHRRGHRSRSRRIMCSSRSSPPSARASASGCSCRRRSSRRTAVQSTSGRTTDGPGTTVTFTFPPGAVVDGRPS